jgi:hypothetical protein
MEETLVTPVSKVSQENKELRVNAVALDPPVQWDLLETKDLPENVVCQDLRVPPDPREALGNMESLESLEKRDPTVLLVAPVTRVHQDLVVPREPLDVMVLPESLDPLDPQVLRENMENLVPKDLKVFLAQLVSLAQREILDLLEKTANQDLVDLLDPEVTMEKMETKVQQDPQDLLESKENEVVLDPQETKVSKVFQVPLVIQEKPVEVENLVSMVNKELQESQEPVETEEAQVFVEHKDQQVFVA